MTPEDRDLLQALRRQQLELQHSLARLDVQLADLEARTTTAPEDTLPHVLPPLPAPPELPAVPTHEEPTFPPLPVDLGTPSAPSFPPLPPPPVSAPKPSLEVQFGRWLTRLGALFGVIALSLLLTLPKVQAMLGAAGLLAISALISGAVVTLGERLERKGPSSLFFGRSITAMGLAWLYLTIYAAGTFQEVRVIHSPLLESLLLLGWSAYVFLLAERKRSQVFALFAIALAYFSSATTPLGPITLAANLILAVTAVSFLVRQGWSVLSYFSLFGTYFILLRRLVIDVNGEFVFDSSRMLPFWPYTLYLVAIWVIFTAAVTCAGSPTFRGGQRLAFLSFNNGALAGFLLLIAYLAGYGHGPMGCLLLGAGLALLVASRFVGYAEIEPEKVMAVYAAQGLALVTAGIMVLYTGITRGSLLLLETLVLGLAAAFSADRVLTVTTYVVGFFATLFLVGEIASHHHPWIFGFSGAAVMLLNAWLARGEVRNSPKARTLIVLPSSYYSVLAIGLLFTSLSTELNEDNLPPALAFTALALTFSIYFVSLYELPPLAQTFLLAAQALVLFPIDTGEPFPWWTTAIVTAVTLLMTTWWSRQRITRTGTWTFILNLIYALALVGLAYQTLHPRVDDQGWMITASLLSFAFLAWGAFTRVWAIAVMGQLFLVSSVFSFFVPPNADVAFPWTWWAALLPIAVVFSTARATHRWLRLYRDIPESTRVPFSTLAYGYHLLALAMLINLIVALVPPLDQISTFLLLGTAVFAWNIAKGSAFGLRCSFVLSLAGIWLYLDQLNENGRAMATFFNGLAFLGFLAQPAFLRRSVGRLVTKLENMALILCSIAAGWLFVSIWVETRDSFSYLTMSWALYALFLFLFGLLFGQPRQRWCGLAILFVAIVRVFVCDFWGLSNGYRVVTFVVLTLVTLGFGYILLRYAAREKNPA